MRDDETLNQVDEHCSPPEDVGAAASPKESGAFPKTHLSQLERARRGERPALEALCAAYWWPVYWFVRSLKFIGPARSSQQEAEECTQIFFLKLLEAGSQPHAENAWIAKYDPKLQPFRSWLRTRVHYYFRNERKKNFKQPSNPSCSSVVLIDTSEAERQWHLEGMAAVSPDRAYDLAFAHVIVRRAQARLEAQFSGSANFEIAKDLMQRLAGEQEGSDEDLAEMLESTPEAVRAKRLRIKKKVPKEFGMYLREEIAAMVPGKGCIEDEVTAIRELIDAFR